ncbi:MAG: NAD-dependent DNA ligase LigA [Lachnospiraceae bacterium]|nr:NAD-dependent DNA ligase LigA [Lachnospiraceae bacterium]
MMTKQDRIKELVEILNKAGRAYYQESREIMSNYEYDALYDELVALEQETGIVLANSPTVNVGYEVLSELPKETHEKPMLSLDKTKEVEGLQSFLGDKDGMLSWKLDGLTVVLTYRDGKLAKAVTRGNGEVGEVVTNNAKTFKNIPLNIAYKDELILRGEAVIKYADFEEINSQIEDVDAKYKNPRNLCAGSVRQLNNEITASRNVNFYAFALVKADGVDFQNSLEKQYEFMASQGFDVVGYKRVNADNVAEGVAEYAEEIKTFAIPSDGLVLIYDDIAYGESLGRTAKFPRNGIAFKWKDETAETTLREMEWSPSRTGLINPVAIFEPVELEGTTVSRASVHNISIVESLKLGIGDRIEVYKANMIIPQISRNLTMSGVLEIPKCCPTCGGDTEIRAVNDVKSLYCTNPKCAAKFIKKFSLFVSRDAMNIDGLSEETLDKFIAKGFIHEYADIYRLNRYEDEIVGMPGFGRKSYDNLIAAIDSARKVPVFKLIYSLGILNVGLANAKVICKHFDGDIDRIVGATAEELKDVEGVGDVIATTYTEYFADEENLRALRELMTEIELEKPEMATIDADSQIAGKTFVITGSVYHFANRNEVKDVIEAQGGKVTGSVTAKTDYLINNDNMSTSSKNKKAKELGIPVITEEEFMAMAKIQVV